jgi:hypothetical protein
MLFNRTFTIAVASLAGSTLIGCQSQPTEMSLKSVGPEGIKAGAKFNPQPDGSNAIWLKTEGIPTTAVPVLAGTELPAVNVRDQGSLVTAVVPAKLTAVAGSYPLLMIDKKSGKKSNEITFVVK